ncbi:hypothetical protein LAZ67_1006995 [Cordylochernes scorpioides]|uniref:Uncharacterized protein n=1 Tax=Cordylochernes scorpioides TaxID=51811 RepID=A0ABY6JZB2_9ARAC|nr:hypothetical protein LAZ67_1006995 [Cordylochernes scorpioides]
MCRGGVNIGGLICQVDIYFGIYSDEELMPERQKKDKKNEATWWTPSKRCCLKRSDCFLAPTPVYFLDDCRRFYQLLSPVLRLLSFTVLRLVCL